MIGVMGKMENESKGLGEKMRSEGKDKGTGT